MPRSVAVSVLLLILAGACERGDTPPPQAPDEPGTAGTATPDATPDVAPADPRPESCAELEPAACSERGTTMLLTASPADAIPLLAWACSKDDADACANLATSYRAKHLPAPEPGVVHELNLRGCAAGSARSCGMLGADYYEGEAVDADLTRAAELFTQACDQGEVASCSLLGTVLASEAEPRDFAGAAKAFGRACELGETAHCKDAGVLYLSKLSQVEPALAMFGRGCTADDAEACYNLGAVHGAGLGVTQDQAEGEKWMKKACELGDQEGCQGAAQLAAAQDPNAVAGANVNVGSMDVNGMTIQDLQCRISGGGGLFGTMALVATLADKKKAFDKCAPKGAAPIIRWDFAGNNTNVINVDDPSEQVAACVEKVMKKVPATMEAQCKATVLIGNKQGAEQAAASH